MVGVEQWAEIRRLHCVERLLDAGDQPADGVASRDDPRGRWRRRRRRGMRGRRRGRSSIRSGSGSASSCGRIRRSSRSGCGRWRASWAMTGGKSIFDDYVREVRPRFLVRRTFQRTIYRPGELVQCDLWEPRELIPVGHGQTRRGYVVTAELCWSRVIAGDAGLLQGGAGHPLGPGPLPVGGSGRCRRSWSGTARARSPAAAARPTRSPAFCGQLGVGWVILDAGDRAGQGRCSSARTGSCARTSSRAGGSRTSSTSSCSSTAGATRSTSGCTARSAPSRPSGWSRSASGCGRCPRGCPTVDRRLVMRVPQQPYRAGRSQRLLDRPARSPAAASSCASRRREVTAVVLDTGELACRHRRVFAGGLTITDPAHQTELERQRARRRQRPRGRGRDPAARPLRRS